MPAIQAPHPRSLRDTPTPLYSPRLTLSLTVMPSSHHASVWSICVTTPSCVTFAFDPYDVISPPLSNLMTVSYPPLLDTPPRARPPLRRTKLSIKRPFFIYFIYLFIYYFFFWPSSFCLLGTGYTSSRNQGNYSTQTTLASHLDGHYIPPITRDQIIKRGYRRYRFCFWDWVLWLPF